MKKRIVLMCTFLLASVITGCSSGKSELEAKNISSELSNEHISQEDSNDISKQYSVDNDAINNENTIETASDEHISQEDSSNVPEQHHVNDDVIGNGDTTELTIESSLNFIDIEQIEKEGGKVEFADIMTYENFQNLGWTNDVDASLDKDEKVYIVKIYYPEGFEHDKVGKIENCEAIGIYSIEDGTYLGGCFRERQ